MNPYRMMRSAARNIRDRISSRELPGKARLGRADSDQWVVVLDPLTSSSVVYSAGVGNDITFERDLVARVGCEIHLFDPSPTGEATMSRPENTHPSLHYTKLGLAGKAGMISFSPPLNPAEGSFFADEGDTSGHLTMPCDTLTSITTRLGHSHIDLLKMDIEGSEYGVIEEIVAGSIPVHQICVEFHPWLGKDGRRKSRIAIASLRRHGYVLFNRFYNDFSFIKKS